MTSRCFCFAYVPPFRPGGGAEIKIHSHQPKLNIISKETANMKHNTLTKIITLALAAVLALSLAACGSKTNDDSGDKADAPVIKIGVPNDTTNEARALQLLAAQGIITVRDGAGLTATVNDIEENPHNVKIEEIEAAQLPRTVADVDFAVINGNYAMEAGFSVGTDALAIEDASSEAAQTYANVLVVKEGNENNPAIQALYAALTSDTIKDFINNTYDGAVVPIF